MSMLEQMIETRALKAARGLTECCKCRLCNEQKETVQHLLAGCKTIASSEYVIRHNRALVVVAVSWAKEYNLLDKNVKWYQKKLSRGHVLENFQAKLVCDFEFNFRKTTTSRRPDLILEEKKKKNIWICDMACPQENNIENLRRELKKKKKKKQTACLRGIPITTYFCYHYGSLTLLPRKPKPGYILRKDSVLVNYLLLIYLW